MKKTLLLFCIYFLHFEFVYSAIEYSTLAIQYMTKKEITTPFVIDKTCLLIPDRGPCRSEITMYFFNPSNRNCSTFSWGGCQGNGNRFDSSDECLSTCLSNSDYKIPTPRFCKLRFDYGYCFGAEPRWYYDPIWKVCKETIFSGCGGNKNNFYAKEQCNQVCLWGKKPLSSNRMPRKPTGKKKVVIVNPFDFITSERSNRTRTTNVRPTSTQCCFDYVKYEK